MNRCQLEKYIRTGLRVVGRLEAMENTVSLVLVKDDPQTGDLLFSLGPEVRRITVAEMITATDNDTIRSLAELARRYVRECSDVRPTEAAA